MNNDLRKLGEGTGLEALSNPDAEEAVLGSVLIDPKAFHRVAAFLKASDFHLIKHAYIWEALQRLTDRDIPFDYLMVVNELRDMGKLQDIGGPAEITYLTNETPTSVHAEIYGRIVAECAMRRELMRYADEIKAQVLNTAITTQQVVSAVEEKHAQAMSRHTQSQILSLSRAISEHFDHVEQAMENNAANTTFGIPTGFNTLDQRLEGLRKGRFTVVAAYTHYGKTSFALSMALNALRLGAHPMYVTMEERQMDLTNRLIGIEAGLAPDALMTGRLTQEEFKRYVEVAGRLSNHNMKLDPIRVLTPTLLENRVRAVQQEQPVDLVIVDYVHLMSAGQHEGKWSIYEKLYAISQRMPEIAERLNIALVVLGQNNRNMRKRKNQTPTVEDFEGCNKFGQTADLYMAIDRPAKWDKAAMAVYPDMAMLHVLKNKINGWHGAVKLHADPITTRFSNWDSQRSIMRMQQRAG